MKKREREREIGERGYEREKNRGEEIGLLSFFFLFENKCTLKMLLIYEKSRTFY